MKKSGGAPPDYGSQYPGTQAPVAQVMEQQAQLHEASQPPAAAAQQVPEQAMQIANQAQQAMSHQASYGGGGGFNMPVSRGKSGAPPPSYGGFGGQVGAPVQQPQPWGPSQTANAVRQCNCQ